MLSKKVRYTDLDGIRGILAVLVVALHLGLNSFVSRISYGHIFGANWGLCVDYFFMLSGFVMYEPLSRHGLTWRSYFNARLFRLYPVYITTLIVTVAVSQSKIELIPLLLNLLLLNHFFNIESFNGPSWSVSFEFFLPILLSILFRVRLLSKSKILFVVLVFSLAGHALLLGAVDPFARFSWFGRALFGLTSGGVVAALIRPIGLPIAMRKTALALFGLSISCMLMVGMAPGIIFAFPAIAILAIVVAARADGLLARKPFQLLGALSYSIYLWHVPMLMLVERAIGPTEKTMSHKAIVIVLTVIVAMQSRRFIEQPFMARAKLRSRAESAP